jgi:hypothetical protein
VTFKSFSAALSTSTFPNSCTIPVPFRFIVEFPFEEESNSTPFPGFTTLLSVSVMLMSPVPLLIRVNPSPSAVITFVWFRVILLESLGVALMSISTPGAPAPEVSIVLFVRVTLIGLPDWPGEVLPISANPAARLGGDSAFPFVVIITLENAMLLFGLATTPFVPFPTEVTEAPFKLTDDGKFTDPENV